MSDEQITRASEAVEHALLRLQEALAEPLSNPLAIDGTIQRFEFTFELFWKLLKRLLEREGVDTTTPREALQAAYKAGWLTDEAAWLQMLRDRNQTSHTYDEEQAKEIYERVRNAMPELTRTYQGLVSRFASVLRQS